MFTGCGVVSGQSQYLTRDAVRPHTGLDVNRQIQMENGVTSGICPVYQNQTYSNAVQESVVNSVSTHLNPTPPPVAPPVLKLGQEGFKKVCRTEEDSPCPFPGLASGVLEMRVKEGSKIRNLMGFAMARMQGEKGGSRGGVSGEGLRQVIFTGSGRAVTKTITCAEIMKRKVGSLHQLTKLRYKVVKEVWESNEGGTSEMTVHRTVPSISILLSKDPLDPQEPGYQPPETLSALWEEKEGTPRNQATSLRRLSVHCGRRKRVSTPQRQLSRDLLNLCHTPASLTVREYVWGKESQSFPLTDWLNWCQTTQRNESEEFIWRCPPLKHNAETIRTLRQNSAFSEELSTTSSSRGQFDWDLKACLYIYTAFWGCVSRYVQHGVTDSHLILKP
ncbi:hypothetical protein LDENG_00211070 [Lucifuga dentata]|nr:hypothetical protein LDENG_00211070 [Lucifuga dentata]